MKRIFLGFAYDVSWCTMWAAVYAMGVCLHSGGPTIGCLCLAVLCRGTAGVINMIANGGTDE